MKIFTKLNDGYAEIESNKDVGDYFVSLYLTVILHCLAWIAGFSAGCFCIYFVLGHFDKILIFLSKILRNLAQ